MAEKSGRLGIAGGNSEKVGLGVEKSNIEVQSNAMDEKGNLIDGVVVSKNMSDAEYVRSEANDHLSEDIDIDNRPVF